MIHPYRRRLDRVNQQIALHWAHRLMPVPSATILAAMIAADPTDLPWSPHTAATSDQPVTWWAGMFLDRNEPCVQRVMAAIEAWEQQQTDE